MAGLSMDSKGWRVTFRNVDGNPCWLRLGKVPRRVAETVKLRVEELLTAKIMGCSPPRETSAWVASIGDKLRSKLVAFGLVDGKRNLTLKEFLDSFIAARPNVLATTRRMYHLAARNLLSYFAHDRRIDTITVGEIDNFRAALMVKYSSNSAKRLLSYCKQFFAHAVNAGYLAASPCKNLRGLSVLPNRETESYLSISDLTKLLATMPLELQTLTVLIRLCGLRVGEAIALRWENVNFAENKLVVVSPKTRVHGKALRTMPLLPEARAYLTAWFEASGTTEHVFPRLVTRKAAQVGLRQKMHRYYLRAGLEPPRRIFQNWRRSAATDFALAFPQHVTASWLGHTTAIASVYYWRTTSDVVEQALSYQRLPTEVLPYISGGNPGGNASASNAMHGTETPTD